MSMIAVMIPCPFLSIRAQEIPGASKRRKGNDRGRSNRCLLAAGLALAHHRVSRHRARRGSERQGTMRLQLCTWQEVEAYLRGSQGIIIPIGSTEQHGPTGFIGTDALCPELIGQGIGERLNAMVAPTISVGMAQHHLGFAGSVTLRPSTLMAVVQDTVNSLARHGFNRFFFLNGHGGNIATVTAAFSEIYAESSLGTAGHNRPSLRCRLQNWWDCDAVKKISAEKFGEAEGSHATASEVSLTYYGYREDGARVRRDALEPRLAPNGPIYDAEDYRRRFPDGRIGSDPTLATAEIGETLFTGAVQEISVQYQEFLSES
jgi:creatinine amidohydrolase